MQGTVRVSVAPGFVPILMRLMLPGVREEHPALEVELSGDFHRADLAKGEADIAVRMARPSEPDLVARRACECGWFVYASTAYLAAHGTPGSPAELARHRLVLYAEALHNVAPLRWMEQHRPSARHVSRVDNLEIACQMIAADGGIAVLPCFIADAVGGLQRVFAERVGVNTGWIVFHETVRGAARIRVVVDALARCFELNATMFSGAGAAA